VSRDDFVVKLKVGRHGHKGGRSRKYRIWIDHDLCGFHVPPKDSEGMIVVGIHPQCKAGTKNEMDTLIHEVAHALYFGEKKARKIAAVVTKVLWKAGYRRELQRKEKP
jgi:hypothetical protein